MFFVSPSITRTMCDINQDNSDGRSTVSLTSLSDDGIMTPTSSDFAKPSLTEYVPSVPGPGKTYKIHLKNTEKVITLTEGRVVLQSPAEAQRGEGYYWACVEMHVGNWLGFRNHVSGTFLGHDGRSGLHAKVTYHQAHESFCVRHHREGGYLLLVRYPRDEMRQIGCAPDGKTLVEKEHGDQWVFEEV